MTDDFTKRWAVELPLDYLENLSKITVPHFRNLQMRIRTAITLEEVMGHLVEYGEISPLTDRVMYLKEKKISENAKFLYDLAKAFKAPFRIMFKDLEPGSTSIGYEIWVEFI